MKWTVRLEGPEEGLNELSQILKNPDNVRIFKKGDFYYAESNLLDTIETNNEAINKTESILAEIKGISQLLLQWNIPIKIGAMVRPNDKGDMIEIVHSNLKCIVRFAPPFTIEHNQQKIVLEPDKFFPQYLLLAMTDELVKYVLQMVDFGFDSWWALYCIEEAIECDIGKTPDGREKKIKLMNQKERTRFRATVNDQSGLIGLLARHGKIRGKKKFNNPMTLHEAKRFIWLTVIMWLNEKIADGNIKPQTSYGSSNEIS